MLDYVWFGRVYLVDGQVAQFVEHGQEDVRDDRRADDVGQVDHHELRATQIVLGAQTEHGRGTHETGH